MADWYVDHGLYNTPIAGGTVPTESEDGNGKGTGKASMATLVLNFTGQPTASQSVTIAGVTFTAVTSGASGNQFNIGASASATASNLVTAINASATNATKPVGSIAATAPLRNIVNATVSGSIVTVYTRISGTEWNSVTESSTLSNVTITQWSGGTDGAWGYFFNPTAIFPTSQAIGAYGVISSGCYLNEVAGGDNIYIRSNKTISISTTSSITITTRTIGSTNSSVNFIIDNSTIWSDGTDPVFAVNVTSANNIVFSLLTSNTAYFNIYGVKYTTSYNFQVNCSLSQSTSNLSILPAGGVVLENCFFKVTGQGYLKVGHGSTASTVSKSCTFNSCYFYIQNNATNPIVTTSSSTRGASMFSFCTFDNGDATIAHTGIVGHISSATTGFTFIGCSFVNFNVGSLLFSATLPTSISGASFYDCNFGNVVYLTPLYSITTLYSTSQIARPDISSIGNVISSKFNKRDFTVDTNLGFTQWSSVLNFPYCNATILDDNTDTTPWSILINPTTISSNITKSYPYTSPNISKINSLPTGTRTITLEYGLEKSITYNASDIWIILEYIDNTGVLRQQNTYSRTGAALTSSTATWSTNTDDAGTTRFTYNKSGILYFNRYKFVINTDYQIKTNTEISAFLCIATAVANTSKLIFLDPYLSVV